MCYHVAIVVELRANIANYFDLKSERTRDVKQSYGSNLEHYFLKATLYALGYQLTDLPPTKKTNLVGRLTVFENKIKSKLKGKLLALANHGILKDYAITYKLNFQVLESQSLCFYTNRNLLYRSLSPVNYREHFFYNIQSMPLWAL
jgi:hypothetical protein